jgi:hypothetical protein
VENWLVGDACLKIKLFLFLRIFWSWGWELNPNKSGDITANPIFSWLYVTLIYQPFNVRSDI